MHWETEIGLTYFIPIFALFGWCISKPVITTRHIHIQISRLNLRSKTSINKSKPIHLFVQENI